MGKVTHQSVDSDLREYVNIQTGLEKLNEVESQLAESTQVIGVNLAHFPRLTGETDDTGRFTRAIQAMQKNIISTSSGIKLATETQLTIPNGVYDISNELLFGEYASVISEGKAIIRQNNATKRIFVFNPVYNIDVQGIKFVGGTHAIYCSNANVDTTLMNIERCEFQVQSDYAIKTLGAGGVDTHMSANLTIRKCKFIYPNGVLYNVCDQTNFNDCWIQVGKTNFQADRAVFYNKNGLLTLDKAFGVPTMGTDASRLSNVRWVDNYYRFKAINCRFGGEDEGIPIVYNFAGASDNGMGGYIIIENSQVVCGLRSKQADASIIYLKTQVPYLIRLEGNDYLLLSPYIGVDPSLNLTTYFSGIADAYKRFNFTIHGNMTWEESSSANAVPTEIEVYTNKHLPLRISTATIASNQPPSFYNKYLSYKTVGSYDTYVSRTLYCVFGPSDTANPNLPVASMGFMKIEKVSLTGRFDRQEFRVAATGVTYFRYGQDGTDVWSSWKLMTQS